MNIYLLITWLMACLLCSGVSAKELQPYQMPDTHVVPIQDTQSTRQYELLIKLPDGYTQNKDVRYPVIYFTDAVWHIELFSAATEFLMEEVILVGISWQKDIDETLRLDAGEHVSRYRDYSVWQSDNPDHQTKYQFGQADKHLAFIRNDVFSYVQKHYRTKPENRSYFGYSLGGLFGAYTLVAQPDSFKNYMLGSPSLWRLPELVSGANKNSPDLNANVFISYGNLEDELSKHVDEFIAYLKKQNNQSLSLTHKVIDGSHQTAFPLTGVSSLVWLSGLNNEGDK